jgi:nickel transport protein
MLKMKKLAIAAALGATVLASTVAEAHGIWFAQRSTQLALLYGVGADDLDMVKRFPQVKSTTAYGPDGKAVPTSLQVDGRLVLVGTENQPSVVASVMDNGMWCKTPDGKWHKKGKDEVPDAVVAERTLKYAVHIRGPLTAPLGALPGHTCADGTVTLKVRNQGLNVIVAVMESPTDQPTKYNRVEHTASLSFVLPHLPE